MPVVLTLSDSFVNLDAVLAARLGRIEDKRSLLADIGEHLLLAADDRFVAEAGPDGAGWRPLSPATLVAAYRKRGGKLTKRGKGGTRVATAGFERYQMNKRILQGAGSRGGLRSSLTRRITGDTVSIGSNKTYATIHQFGGMAGRGHTVDIPARAYVGVSTGDRGVIREKIVAFVAERLGAEAD